MFITTGVDAIYRDYLTDRRTRAAAHDGRSELRALAAAGQFPPGSMGPKVEAALRFLERGGEEVVDLSPRRARRGLRRARRHPHPQGANA